MNENWNRPQAVRALLSVEMADGSVREFETARSPVTVLEEVRALAGKWRASDSDASYGDWLAAVLDGRE